MTRFAPALQGAVYMMLAAVSWTVMLLLVRALGDAYSTFEILFVRNLVTVAFIVPLLVRSGGRVFRTQRMPLHCTRVAFAYIGILGLFYGLVHIPVADVVALSFTQPLFIAVLAAILLGETVGMARWRAVAIGFAGVLVILRPGFEAIGFATLAVLASAAAYGASNICIKRLMTTDTPVQSTLYGSLLMLPLSALPAAFVWVTPGLWDALAMVGVGPRRDGRDLFRLPRLRGCRRERGRALRLPPPAAVRRRGLAPVRRDQRHLDAARRRDHLRELLRSGEDRDAGREGLAPVRFG